MFFFYLALYFFSGVDNIDIKLETYEIIFYLFIRFFFYVNFCCNSSIFKRREEEGQRKREKKKTQSKQRFQVNFILFFETKLNQGRKSKSLCISIFIFFCKIQTRFYSYFCCYCCCCFFFLYSIYTFMDYLFLNKIMNERKDIFGKSKFKKVEVSF